MVSPRKRVAILGGGMAGLATAYHLTRTEDLRARHEVTIYQLGWRLGGKGATGRDRHGRILEHGLHIWFGYYDNAFRLLREVYADTPRCPDDAMRGWRDALKPHSFTPVGPDYFPLNWPVNDGEPGDGHVFWTPWQAFTQLLGLLAATARTWHEARIAQGVQHASPIPVPPHVTARLAEAGVVATPKLSGGFAFAHEALEAAQQWAQAIGPSHEGPLHHHLASLADLMQATTQGFATSLAGLNADHGQRLMHELLDIAYGYAHGFVHDFMLAGCTARELDAQEFRAWLVSHGSERAIVERSFITRALYDTMFEYVDGDPARASYGAGTAAQVILRMFGTTKGAALYEMQAGMGEVVVAPMYRLLKARGVHFRFFREVTRLALDPSRRAVAEVHLTRQADTLRGDYQPTFRFKGLDCWPDRPFWDQLVGGDALRDAGVDFESPWSHYTPAGTEVLRQGADFDEVVLAISLGAFKKLSDDATLADELCAAQPAFKAMTEALALQPSMAIQLWSPRTLDELGWHLPRPATVATGEPLDIWADMTPSLAFEGQARDLDAARSVHYLTGAMASQDFRRPRSARDTPQRARAELMRIGTQWLATQGPRMWPKAVGADGGFDWQVLQAGEHCRGPARLAEQYVRANVSPAECCVVTVAGSTAHRLPAGGSGFANLTLAGTWIDTGFNTECIEAAVMSGMQAARAICGEPSYVLGEDLLQRRGHGLDGALRPFELVAELGEFAQRQARRVLRWLFGDGASPPTEGRP